VWDFSVSALGFEGFAAVVMLEINRFAGTTAEVAV